MLNRLYSFHAGIFLYLSFAIPYPIFSESELSTLPAHTVARHRPSSLTSYYHFTLLPIPYSFSSSVASASDSSIEALAFLLSFSCYEVTFVKR